MTTPRVLATAASGGAAVLFATAAMLSAQNASGLQQVLTLTSDLRVDDNFDLSESSPGTATIWTNTLQYALQSDTATDSFTGTVAGDLRFADLPRRGQDTSLDNGRVDLSFQRAIDDSTAQAQLTYSDVDIEFNDPLRTITSDGVFIEELGEGRVSNLALSASADLNTQSPLSFRLAGGLSIRDYQETIDPSLRDAQTQTLSAEVGMEVSPGYRVILDTDYRRAEEENNFLDSERIAVSTGLVAALTPTTNLDIRIGYSEIEAIRANDTDTKDSGTVLRFRLAERLSDGNLTLAGSSQFTDSGRQDQATIGRDWTRPTSRYTLSVGGSQSDGSGFEPLVNLGVQIQRPTALLSLTLNQSLTAESDGGDVLNTGLRASFQNQINPVSSWGVSALAGQQTYTGVAADTENDVSRLTLSANYSHNITQDWQVSTGLTHRYRDEENVGTARSNAAFVTLTRQFSAR